MANRKKNKSARSASPTRARGVGTRRGDSRIAPTPHRPPHKINETILLEFSMSPLTKGESVGEYVSRSLEIIDQSGLDYRLNPMGTVIEGPWDEVLGVVKACWERMKQDCDRVSTTIKIDYRKGKTGRLNSKVESIEKKLGRKLKT
ncbi:MAG TPA: MTH1187 family thiamine-binding protein [Candidatus Manganitrophaceae bacterium]|nr:MTH1187 family thiamine-binding protein [Candidatus Manganitrophaceae bacterium]